MPHPQTLDHLIEDLGSDLTPVRRLWRPVWRGAAWIGVVGLAALTMAMFADTRTIAQRLMGAPDMWLAVVGSTLTAVLGGIAAFQLSVPDRGPLWALLPVPSLLVWILASGLGCLRTWFIPGVSDASMREAGHCFVFIVAVSVPLSVLTLVMIRRAYPLRPGLTAAVAGLAIAAAAATLLNFFHPYDASATDLATHFAAVLLVVAVNRLLAAGGR